MRTRPTKEVFAENLRNLLIAKNKKQVDLAKYLNTTKATVTHWVNGENVPRMETIDRICTFLGCTPEQLTTDHTQIAIPAPADVLAEEIIARPILFQMFMLAMKASDEKLQECIEVLKK